MEDVWNPFPSSLIIIRPPLLEPIIAHSVANGPLVGHVRITLPPRRSMVIQRSEFDAFSRRRQTRLCPCDKSVSRNAFQVSQEPVLSCTTVDIGSYISILAVVSIGDIGGPGQT